MRSLRIVRGIAAIAIIAVVSAPAFAQREPSSAQRAQSRGQRTEASEGATLHIPSREPVIQLTANAPSEARVGQSFDYQIQVKNVSRDVVVYNLVIAQHASENFEIESSRINRQQQRQSSQSRSQGQSSRTQPQESTAKRKESEQSESEQEDEGQEEETSKQAESRQTDSRQTRSEQQNVSQDDQQQDKSRWTIKELRPGQAVTIDITAVSDADGQGNVCLAVESFTSALCLATKFTKPELEIVKQAPDKADICQDIEFHYYVKNTGTGDLEKFTIEDDLPEGLQTIDGKSRLEFTLDDGLESGDVRKFVATLRAEKAGEFSSRAVVRGPEGISAQSNNVTVQVQMPKLAVAIDGPSAEEIDSLANYTVRVTNVGDAPAPNSQLVVHFPRSADLVRVSEPRRSSRAVEDSSYGSQQSQQEGSEQAQKQARNQQRTQENASREQQDARDSENRSDRAQRKQASQQFQSARQRQGESRSAAQRQWDLGTLEPGQTMEVSYVLRPYEPGDFQQTAIAEYVCAAARDRQLDRAMFRAEATESTEIIALPGLRVTVIDNDDPIPLEEQVTYTITVLNQGEAEARNIQISAQLPEHLEFVEASGETDAKSSQGEVSFEPVSALGPGEKVQWQLIADVKQPGKTKIKVELTSADLDQAINVEEPTTLYDSEGDSQQEKQPSPQQDSEERAQQKPKKEQAEQQDPQQPDSNEDE